MGAILLFLVSILPALWLTTKLMELLYSKESVLSFINRLPKFVCWLMLFVMLMLVAFFFMLVFGTLFMFVLMYVC